MRKKICLILSTLLSVLTCFVGCKENEDNSGKISLVGSEMYGVIKPVDIYQVRDGAMEGWNNKSKKLKKGKNYFAYEYKDIKMKEKSEVSLLAVNTNELKISIWDSYREQPANALTPEKYRVYYSEYWGAKTRVSFVANISFYKTLHIKLEEKSSSYKITYYGQEYSGIYGVSFAFNDMKSLNTYKNVIELPKSDIIKIEYFA